MSGAAQADGWRAASDGACAGARAAWVVVNTHPLPPGWDRTLQSKGFIAHDLRFCRGTDWMFSAVLNQGWVLWYGRRPAMCAGLVDPQVAQARFPAARLSRKGEIMLRLHDQAEAAALVGWCLGAA